MSRAERVSLLTALEKELGHTVLTYVTSTRRKAEAQMSLEAVRFAYEHLRGIAPRQNSIGLLVHSHGGEPSTSWRLMNLLREYADEVVILVPHLAFSAATLLALGADRIVMHPMAALGPTDPSIIGPFNPRDPQGNPLPISVEDVLSYIALVRDDVRINHEDEVIQAFTELTKHVSPLALGSVKRSHSQARLLAKKLLQLRQAKPDDHKVNELVENLTSKLYYHGHPINREEAVQLGLPIEKPTPPLEAAMWSVYQQYETDMGLLEEFSLDAELLKPAAKQHPQNPQVLTAALELPFVYVESAGRCDAFVTHLSLAGTKDGLGGVTGSKIVSSRSAWRQE
jgi:hypothetical protein